MRWMAALGVALLVGVSAAAQQSEAYPSAELQSQAAPYAPKYPGDPAHSEAEAVSLGYMHTAVYAEKLYFRKHHEFASSLYALVGSGSFTRRMVATERGDYSVSYRPRKDHFALALTPRQFDAAHRAFWTNENGTVRVESDKPASEESPVLRPD